MFEHVSAQRSTTKLALKALAISACGILIGIGFCGLDAHFYPNAEFGGSFLAGIGAVLLGLSAIGIMVGISGLLIAGIVWLLWR